MTGAINDLFCCKDWDTFEIHSDYISNIPKEVLLPSSIPFAQVKQLSVIIDEGDICKADAFIDDVKMVGVNKEDNSMRLKAAPCSICIK